MLMIPSTYLNCTLSLTSDTSIDGFASRLLDEAYDHESAQSVFIPN